MPRPYGRGGGRPQLLLVLRNRNGESMACQGGMFHGTQRRVGDGTVRPWWTGALASPRIPWDPCHLPVANGPLPGCGYVPWDSGQFGHNTRGCCSSSRRSNFGQWPVAFGAYTRSCERTMVLPCPGGLVCCLGIALEPLNIWAGIATRYGHGLAWRPLMTPVARVCLLRLDSCQERPPGAPGYVRRPWAVSTWIQSPSAAGNPPAAAQIAVRCSASRSLCPLSGTGGASSAPALLLPAGGPGAYCS